MNLYSVDIRVEVEGQGAKIERTLTFHASASAMVKAIEQCFTKAHKWLQKEYSYLRPFKRTALTAERATLLDEKW